MMDKSTFGVLLSHFITSSFFVVLDMYVWYCVAGSASISWVDLAISSLGWVVFGREIRVPHGCWLGHWWESSGVAGCFSAWMLFSQMILMLLLWIERDVHIVCWPSMAANHAMNGLNAMLISSPHLTSKQARGKSFLVGSFFNPCATHTSDTVPLKQVEAAF